MQSSMQHHSLLTSKTQSVMLLLVRGTRTASPLSLPLRSGKIRAMAVALPVLVGARFTSPDLRVCVVIIVAWTIHTRVGVWVC